MAVCIRVMWVNITVESLAVLDCWNFPRRRVDHVASCLWLFDDVKIGHRGNLFFAGSVPKTENSARFPRVDVRASLSPRRREVVRFADV